MAEPRGDLSITALYTSATWSWGHLPDAQLFATREAKFAFWLTNAVLWIARLFRRDLPSLRCSLLQRHVMIDRIARDARPHQLLELASGLSRRGATLSADKSLRCVEVDLPAVVARKRELLGRTAEGRALLERDNYRLVAADVEVAALGSLIEPGPSLLVVAEGLFMYLDPDGQRQLWRKIRRLFEAGSGRFVFDLVPAAEQPPPGLVGRALEALMKLFTRGRSFERDRRTRGDIKAELLAAGFAQVELIEPGAVARAWSLPFPDAKTQQLLFLCRP